MGLRTLGHLKANKNVYDHMENLAIMLEKGYKEIIEKHELPLSVARFKAMVCLFFAEGPIVNYDDVTRCDTDQYASYFREMLQQGILMPPAQFEGLFLSSAHTEADVIETLEKTESALIKIFEK